jgi:hypothetical protein
MVAQKELDLVEIKTEEAMGVLITDDEMDDEERCELLQDEDSRCPNRATQSVREPYTPASFEMRVCDECARSQIHFGYIAPMSLRRVAFALKEAYKAARCGSWEELYYFNGLLTTFFVRRGCFGRLGAVNGEGEE